MAAPVMPNRVRAVLTALADADVRFVVCGGVACILHGVARATHDLDVRVPLDDDALRRLVHVARTLNLAPRIPEPLEALLDPTRRRAWIEDERAMVYTLRDPTGTFALDVFLRYPVAFDALWADAAHVVVDGRTVRISSIIHLIEANRAVQPPRKQDLRDIEDLLERLHAR